MHKIAKILFFCMIFVVNNISGQKSSIYYPIKKIEYWPDSIFKKSFKFSTNNSFKRSDSPGTNQLQIFRPTDYFINTASCRVISADFYTRNFGFFCKKELEFEKMTKIPFRFRLGSVRYTDYLEGKPNSGVL